MPTSVKELLAAANATVPRIGREEAAMLMAQGALVVDVRDAPELQAAGKVAGAMHVSRGLLEFKADPSLPAYHDPAIDPAKKLVTYCASGGRSALAAKTLKDMGYPKVAHMVGGFTAWREEGKQVARARE